MLLLERPNEAINPETLKGILPHTEKWIQYLCDHKEIRMSFNSTSYTQSLENAIWL